MRVGHVPLYAVNGQVAGQRAATAVFHHIADDFGAGGFADQAIIQALVARHQCFNNLNGAVFRAGFFIRSDQEGQTTFMIWILSDKTFGGDDHCRERAFHIRGAAAKQHAVANGGFKGGVNPAIGVPRRDDIGMAGKRQRFPAPAPGPEVLGIPEIHRFNGKANRTQAFNH